MTEDQKGEAQDGFREPWHTLLNRHDVLIVDTETTGLDERAEVIDVAVIDTTGAVRFDAVSMPSPWSGACDGAPWRRSIRIGLVVRRWTQCAAGEVVEGEQHVSAAPPPRRQPRKRVIVCI